MNTQKTFNNHSGLWKYRYAKQGSTESGYVYLMSVNGLINGERVYKIGFSSNPERRAYSLRRQHGIKFKVIHSIVVDSPFQVEQDILNRLKAVRVPYSEFVQADNIEKRTLINLLNEYRPATMFRKTKLSAEKRAELKALRHKQEYEYERYQDRRRSRTSNNGANASSGFFYILLLILLIFALGIFSA